jgi:hypothetical protein
MQIEQAIRQIPVWAIDEIEWLRLRYHPENPQAEKNALRALGRSIKTPTIPPSEISRATSLELHARPAPMSHTGRTHPIGASFVTRMAFETVCEVVGASAKMTELTFVEVFRRALRRDLATAIFGDAGRILGLESR